MAAMGIGELSAAEMPAAPAGVMAAPCQRAGWAQPSDWEEHRAEITKLHRDEGKTVKEIEKVMQQRHGFRATPKMFKDRFRKWGLYRYVRESEALDIARLKAERDAKGKVTEIYYGDTKIDYARVDQHLRRKGKSKITNPNTPKGVVKPQGPRHRGIKLRTPPPESPPPSSSLGLPYATPTSMVLPRQLRSSGSLYVIDKMLPAIQDWYKTGFGSGKWQVVNGSWVVRNHNDNAITNFVAMFRRATRRFLSAPAHPTSFQLLNNSCRLLESTLREQVHGGSPDLIVWVMMELVTLRATPNIRTAELARELLGFAWKYTSDVVFDATHPLSRILEALAGLAGTPEEGDLAQLIIACRFIGRLLEKAAGPLSHIAIWTWRRCWQIEDIIDKNQFHEASERGTRLALSRSGPGSSPGIAGELRRTLAELCFMNGRLEEAMGLILEALGDDTISVLEKSSCLRLQAQLELSLGLFSEATQSIKAGFALAEEAVGITDIQTLDSLEILIYVLQKSGDEDAAIQARLEFERRLRLIEGC